MKLHTAPVLLALWLWPCAAGADSGRDRLLCAGTDAAIAAAACTRLIDGGALSAAERTAALFHRGEARLKMSDTVGAVADLTGVVQLEPDNAEALNARGGAWLEQDKFAEALADFDEALRLDPNLFSALHGRAEVHRRRGEHERAVEDEAAAVRSAFGVPPPSPARTGADWDTCGGDRIPDIIHACGRLLATPSLLPVDRIEASNNRGKALDLKGDADGAIADFDAVIALRPNDGLAFTNRGDAYLDTGEFDRAIADYAHAIAVGSGDGTANAKLDKARRAKREALRARPAAR